MNIIVPTLICTSFTVLGILTISIINTIKENLQGVMTKDMGLFWKKKEQEKSDLKIEFTEPKHECIMKDFPWYMETWYSSKNKTAGYRITEPYLCIECGKRIDKTLETIEWSNITPEEREGYYKNIRERYKQYLKPRAIVEDMINNVLYVKDPEHLKMIEKLRGIPHSGCGSSNEMKESDFQIKIKEKKKND